MSLPAVTGDYACTSPIPATAVNLRFSGRFQDREVAWDATFYTLQHFLQAQGAQNTRPFIDIAQALDGGYRLRVGLDLPLFDEPAIKKAVIMIRNYKRLRLGRHEWGEEVTISVAPGQSHSAG